MEVRWDESLLIKKSWLKSWRSD